MEKLMIDSDVIINWLTREVKKAQNIVCGLLLRLYWNWARKENLTNHTSLLSIFEIRFVLRRKKL